MEKFKWNCKKCDGFVMVDKWVAFGDVFKCDKCGIKHRVSPPQKTDSTVFVLEVEE